MKKYIFEKGKYTAVTDEKIKTFDIKIKNSQRFCGRPRPLIITCQPSDDAVIELKIMKNKKTADSVIFPEVVLLYSLV